jgi:hypothetical protein
MAGPALNFRNGLHPVINVEFPENLVQMIFHGIGTDAQDAPYLGIGFTLPYPIHYLDFSLAQSLVFGSQREE